MESLSSRKDEGTFLIEDKEFEKEISSRDEHYKSEKENAVKIAEAHLEGFKGGQGKLDTRNYVDDKVKIMYSTLRPGASTGLHTHEGNCEIIYVVSGTATFHYDDVVEEVRQGQVHYCPMNHAHYMENLTDHDLVYLAIVPEHH